MNVYYVADLRRPLGDPLAPPDGVEVRPISAADILALSELYARAYGLGPDAHEDAVKEMESAFDGTWGDLWPKASPVAWTNGVPVAVVQTVHRPSMEDAPTCPWLIEVLTDPVHQRRGLARSLVIQACAVVRDAGHDRVGLTVDTDNRAALSLYRTLGFTPEGS